MAGNPFTAPAVTASMIYGSTAQARVVDTKDPLEQGRVRIRLAGQDAIPVNQLPWIKPMGSHFSGVGAHGESLHQYLIGQYVNVQLDGYGQITSVLGGINTPAQGGSAGDGSPSNINTGIPQATQDKTATLKHQAGTDKNHIVEASGALTMADGVYNQSGIQFNLSGVTHIEKTLKQNNGAAQHDQKPTSAPQTQQLFDAIKHIKNWDSGNISGAIKPALDAMQNLLQGGGAGGGNPFQSMAGMMGSAFGAFAAAAAAAGSNAQANTTTVGQACLLENLNTGETANGTVQQISGVLTCVPLIPTANTPNMIWVPQFIPPTTATS